MGTLYSREPDLFLTGCLWIGDYKRPPIDKHPAEKLGLVHETRDFLQREEKHFTMKDLMKLKKILVGVINNIIMLTNTFVHQLWVMGLVSGH